MAQAMINERTQELADRLAELNSADTPLTAEQAKMTVLCRGDESNLKDSHICKVSVMGKVGEKARPLPWNEVYSWTMCERNSTIEKLV